MKIKKIIASTALASLLALCGCYQATTPSSSDPTPTSTETNIEPSSEDKTEETNDNTVIFDTSIYRLKVEVSDTNIYTVVSVYGNSEDDFSEMLSTILDAAHSYNIAEDDATITNEFNSIIGTEGGSGKTWDDAGIITSAPNDVENTYRADLYIYK